MAWRRLATLLLTSTLLALVFGLEAPARSTARFTLVDRTLVCTATVDPLGDRTIGVSASPHVDSINQPNSPARAWVVNGTTPSFFVVAVEDRAAYGRAGGVWTHRSRCRRAATRIPLSAKGLPGPAVRWATGGTCRGVGRAVLVRIRARFESPTTWVTFRAGGQSYLRAQGRLLEGSVAVRTERTRRPLAFMVMNDKGETRFYASPSCD
jgi:hypothetical protein